MTKTFRELLGEALIDRLRFVEANKEALVMAWVAQHGWAPDECCFVQKEESDGSIRMWVERRGEYGELLRLRQEVAELRKR